MNSDFRGLTGNFEFFQGNILNGLNGFERAGFGVVVEHGEGEQQFVEQVDLGAVRAELHVAGPPTGISLAEAVGFNGLLLVIDLVDDDFVVSKVGDKKEAIVRTDTGPVGVR